MRAGPLAGSARRRGQLATSGAPRTLQLSLGGIYLLPTERERRYGAHPMFRSRRSLLVALAAFLLAIGPATTSARAQLVRWLELDADPAAAAEVRLAMMSGSRTLRSVRIRPIRRAEVQRARFVGSGGEVDLTGQLLDYQPRMLVLPVPLLNQTPGWVAVELQPVEREWTAERWRSFLAAEALLDVVRPPADDRPVRLRSSTFFKVLVHRRNGAPAGAVAQPVGQPLEIVPLSDPVALGGNVLPLRVLLRGTPAAGVRIFAAAAEAFGSTSATTDAEGKASLALPAAGRWVLFATVVGAGTPREVLNSIVTIERK